MSRRKTPSIRKCSVEVEFPNFSSSLLNKGDVLRGPKVYLMGERWSLFLKNESDGQDAANEEENGKEINSLGCYLMCWSFTKMSVSFSFHLINQKHGKPDEYVHSEELASTFNSAQEIPMHFESFGVPKFIPRSMLKTRASEFLVDDTLIIRLDLSVAPTIEPTQELTTQNNWAALQNVDETFDFEIHVPHPNSEDGDNKSFSVIRTHKLVLSAFSEVFKAMLYGPMIEGGSDKIVIDDFSPEAVKTMVNFCYTGEVDTDDYHEILDTLSISSNAIEIVKVADTLSLDELKDTAINFITADPTFAETYSEDLRSCKKKLLIDIVHKVVSERKTEGRKRKLHSM